MQQAKVVKYNKLNFNLITGIALILLVSTPVVLCYFLPLYDVNAVDSSLILKSPSWGHFFGTDNFGRDIFARVMQGAATTFGIAILTVLIGALIGSLIGALTGFYGGIVDEILMRINDGLASFPSILLAMVVVSVLDAGTLNICIALGLVFIPSFARIMRAEFLKERQKDYVLAAKLMGASDLRIIFLHILPNTLSILGSSALVGLNNAVLAEAGLSYLGLGVQPPDPSLGRMLAESQVYIFSAPWYVFSSCGVMIVAMLGISLIGSNLGVSGVNLNAVKKKIDRLRPENGIKSVGEAEEAAGNEDNSENSEEIIRVDSLGIAYIEDEGLDRVIEDLSFSLRRGEILGIVGESGSGKSLTSLAIMGILPRKAHIVGGEIYYRDMALSRLDKEAYRQLRAGKLAMIFQEPMTSLDPCMRIGRQMEEVLITGKTRSERGKQTEGDIRKANKERILQTLKEVGLEEAELIFDQYPHELSGGMRQRVMIAMAVLEGAEVIIADEPTTALDAEVSDVIIDLFKEINAKYGTSIILISHDLRVISRICSRAIVMRDGHKEEEIEILGQAGDQAKGGFMTPATRYGRDLLAAAYSSKTYRSSSLEDKAEEAPEDTIVELRNYSVFYAMYQGIFHKKEQRTIIDKISLSIKRGEVYGLVGPSGCGKTTLVKAIAGLQPYTSGQMDLRCKRPGMVFQDPYSSINPAYSVRWLLEEPLRLNSKLPKADRLAELKKIMASVGLGEELLNRRVSGLSGGQRQRISIALNLLAHQELIILDEPLSALDVTLQEQVLELLMKLKEEYGLTYILISHDKRLVSRVCDRVYSFGEL